MAVSCAIPIADRVVQARCTNGCPYPRSPLLLGDEAFVR